MSPVFDSLAHLKINHEEIIELSKGDVLHEVVHCMVSYKKREKKLEATKYGISKNRVMEIM